ncbi:MAG: hypothetical protein V4531_10470 [Actinomycetota bacterium]
MRRVAYGGESFITSDDGAAALLEFAAMAAMSGVAEVVSIPTVLADGRVVVVDLVIGPSSELLTSPIETTLRDPDTRAATLALRTRASQLGASSSHVRGGAIAALDLAAPDGGDPEPF